MAEVDITVQGVANEAIRLLGGPVEAARKLDIPKYQTVQSWRENGVPVRYCRRVNELTGLSLQCLRPDDWFDYWPELAEPKAETGA